MQLNTLKLFKSLVDKSSFSFNMVYLAFQGAHVYFILLDDIFTEEQLKEHLISMNKIKTAKRSNPIMASCLTQIIDQLENLTA